MWILIEPFLIRYIICIQYSVEFKIKGYNSVNDIKIQ